MMNRHTQRRSDEATKRFGRLAISSPSSRSLPAAAGRSVAPSLSSSSSPSSLRRSVAPSLSYSAFTLIEILVSISIIAILAGMIIYGVRSVMTNSKRSATRITLQNTAGMLEEWSKANNGMVNLPAGPLDVANCPPGSANLLQVQENFPERTGNRILLTRAVLKRFMRVPAIAKMQQQLPQQTLLNFALPATGGDWAGGNTYYLGDRVVWPVGGLTYICGSTDTGNAPGTPAGAAIWFLYDANNPAFLDAFGNPILFVPATGLSRVTINTLGTTVTSFGIINRIIDVWDATAPPYNPGDYVYYTDASGIGIYRCVESPVAGTRPGTTAAWVRQPAKPFFASAGPDGNFTTGDDNIYSFEN